MLKQYQRKYLKVDYDQQLFEIIDPVDSQNSVIKQFKKQEIISIQRSKADNRQILIQIQANINDKQ